MFGVGLKFLFAILQFGAVILVVVALIWVVAQLIKLAIVWIAPQIGADATEIFATIRGWLPKRPVWLKKRRTIRRK